MYKTPVTPDHQSHSFNIAKRNKFAFMNKNFVKTRKNEQTLSQQDDDRIS